MPDKVLKTIQPRKYQQEIYENCKEKSCLCMCLSNRYNYYSKLGYKLEDLYQTKIID